MGSYGAAARASKTWLIDHEGVNALTTGLALPMPFTNWARIGLSPRRDPSGKPL